MARFSPVSALRAFLNDEAAGGIVLIVAAACAMIAANTSLATGYFALLRAPAGEMSVQSWINDGLMALFFLLVGLEIKRELLGGALADAATRRLPILAAAAGMIVPACVYLGVSGGDPALARGWAIPAATDIAFAIGVLALLGDRVPPSLKLFLTTVAIVDDMGAVAIIALFYSHGLDLGALAAAMGMSAILAALNRRGVRTLWPYLLAGGILWWLILLSGIHATVAGVLAAAFIPVAEQEEKSPLHRLEHGLSPWVAFAVVPLFGLANAGVALRGVGFSTLAIAVAAGLFLGKQAGILGGIVMAERFGIAGRPVGATWTQTYGVALIAGIGFTMSLFIGALAFPGNAAMLDEVKIGVLAGSLLSAAMGFAVLRLAPSARG